MENSEEKVTQFEQITSEEEERRRRKQERQERQKLIINIIKIVLLVVIILFFLSFLYEGVTLEKVEISPTGRTDFEEIAKEVKPPIEDISVLFPDSITGYVTKARHLIKYSNGLQAEAIYEPEDMSLQLKMPMTVYCLLTYYGSDARIQKDLMEIWKGYPVEQKKINIQGETAYTGYIEDKTKYFIGFRIKGYSLKIYSMFTQSNPDEKRNYLKNHATNVAEEVVKRIREGVIVEEETGEEQ